MAVVFSRQATSRPSVGPIKVADLDLNDPKDFAIAVRRIYDSRGQYKSKLEREYEMNVGFLKGGIDQWKKWDPSSGKTTLDPAINEDMMLISLNLILEVVENSVSQFLAVDSPPQVKPVSEDHNDIRSARLLEQLLEYFSEEDAKLQIQYARFLTMVHCSSVAFAISRWNPNAGNLTKLDLQTYVQAKVEDQLPWGVENSTKEQLDAVIMAAILEFAEQFGEEAQIAGEAYQYEGTLEFRSASVKEMCWYPWKPATWNDVDWYVWSTEVPVEEMAEELGTTVEEARLLAGSTAQGPVQGVMRNRVGGSLTNGTIHQDIEVVLRHEAWRKRCLEYPEGVQGVVYGLAPEATKHGPIDNYCHKAPVFPLVQHNIAGQAPGTCVVSQIRSLQQSINKQAMQNILYRDKNLFPTLLVPEDCIVDNDDWELVNQPGAHKKIRGANRPDWLKPPSIAVEYLMQMDADINMLRELASAPSIQVGNAKDAGVKSGRAIIALDEKSRIRQRNFGKEIRQHKKDIFTLWAEELQMKPVGDRIAQIAGEGNEIEVIEWRADTLRPTSWGVPNRQVAIVQIEPLNDMPMSRTQAQNLIMGLAKTNLLVPGRDDDMAWKMLTGTSTNAFRDRDRKDRAKQGNEIRQWLKGVTVPLPIATQNHDIHIAEIEEWQRSGTEYEELVAAMPFMKPEIDRHLRYHHLLKLMNPIKEVMMTERAKMQAYAETMVELMEDARAGLVMPEVAQRTGESLMMNFGAVAGPGPAMGLPMQDPNNPQQNQPNQQGQPQQNGQPQGQNPPSQPPENQPRKAPMSPEQRDQRKDLSATGHELAPRQ